MKSRVFISYSRSDKEHVKWVNSLKDFLSNNDIDVIIDELNLKLGHSISYFQESMVRDKEIAKVLVILDETYVNKANNRMSGVGNEVQIMMSEIQDDVMQEKFIPIVRQPERGEKPDLPYFLKDRLYLNLSENLEIEYERLLENILGEESYKKLQKKRYQETIREAPTVFFSYRFRDAFPGVREVVWFEKEEAIKRLQILLKPLTYFKKVQKMHGVHGDPIWWFRGRGALPIKRFKQLGEDRFIMNYEELKINRIAVSGLGSYYSFFVYVETEPDSPIGLYDYQDGDIERCVESRGYYYERYGLYNNIAVKGEEYDDGAAVINGDVISIIDGGESEIRERYLTPYNFIIVPKTSPINSTRGNELGEKYMNAILKGDKTVEQFAEEFIYLPRNQFDN